tara:strand:- start:38 stop:421 length:384 start_codon:yes stop_codon:yes gene_type:complete
MLGIDITHLDINPEKQVELLRRIIHSTERYFLEGMLRKLNVPGRTRIYKTFGWSFNYNHTDWEESRNERDNRERLAVEEILRHTDFLVWAEAYMKNYTIQNWLRVFEESNINLDGFKIHVVEKGNEA